MQKTTVRAWNKVYHFENTSEAQSKVLEASNRCNKQTHIERPKRRSAGTVRKEVR